MSNENLDLMRSPDASGILIAFQPIVSATKRGIIVYGYEALARGSDGRAPPILRDSMPSEMLYALDCECRRQAVTAAKAVGLQANLSINVTPGAICHPRYGLRQTINFARDVGFPMDRIIFEITEREIVTDYRPLRACIDECRQDGVRIALDDFGTGFNGLSTLLELRPDIVKIDMTLIQKIETDLDRQALMFGICSGGARLKMRLIAEGVETLESVETLSQSNIDLMQGYFFAKPEIGRLPLVKPQMTERTCSALSRLPHSAHVGDLTGSCPAL